MPTLTKARRWFSDPTNQPYPYMREQRSITLTADELFLLLGRVPKDPADGDHGKGEPDGNGQVRAAAVKLQIDDREALKRDLHDLDMASQDAGKALKNILVYAVRFGEGLSEASKRDAVDCGALMAPYRQCGAWVLEVMKEMAKVQCALSRVGGHVGFTHTCPAPPCVPPAEPDSKTGAKTTTRRLARARQTASNDRQASAT